MIVEAVAVVCLIWYVIVIAVCSLGIIQLYEFSLPRAPKSQFKLTYVDFAGTPRLHVEQFPIPKVPARRM
jgi:hypothetical protein